MVIHSSLRILGLKFCQSMAYVLNEKSDIYEQKKVDEDKDKDKKGRNEEAKHGIGRSIPVKQVCPLIDTVMTRVDSGSKLVRNCIQCMCVV
jgi:hypothetical protein